MSTQHPIIRIFTLICALLGPFSAHAAEETPNPASDAPVCSVITVAPGDSLDSLFGHTAIRIKDPYLGDGDVWFDYGVFNPNDWTFWIHYAKGDAKYLLVAADPQSRLDYYKEQGRAVVEQKLDLTAEEARKLEEYLVENLRHPEYEYRFLDDNCTTRAKEAIDTVAGSQWLLDTKGNDTTDALERLGLEMMTGREIPAKTYRNYTDLYLAHQPLVQLGANLFMGAHAERRAHRFLPDHLNQTFLDFCLPRRSAPKYLAWVLPIAFAILFLAVSLPTLLRWRKRKPLPTRPYLDALLFLSIGLIGCLMTFLGLWSRHPELGAFNWNLIWCWPTHLIFACLLLFAAHSQATRTYARIAAIGASCAALAYFFVPQALPTPLFPLVLLLGVRAWRWGWGISAASNIPALGANP